MQLQKKYTCIKKTNNPELGTGWHRKKGVKITNTYNNQNTNKSQASRDPPPNPKTNKQTNSFESMICPIKFIAQVFRYYYNNITNYMNTYRNADSKTRKFENLNFRKYEN